MVLADHKIDWGASDYKQADGSENTGTNPYTYGPLGGDEERDGGLCGTEDDYPPAPVPVNPPPGCTSAQAQDVTQAGAHPYLNAFVRYCKEQSAPHIGTNPCDNGNDYARLRNLTLKLPPGMVGNPQAAAPCPWAILVLGVAQNVCPNSVVGVVRNWVMTGGLNDAGTEQPEKDVLLFNAETIGGEPARLASDWREDGGVPPLPIVFAARQRNGDVGIDSFTDNIPATYSTPQQHLKIMEQDITLFPKVPVERGCEPNCLPQSTSYATKFTPKPGAQPFFTNPTSCGPKTVGVEANSWEEPGPTNPNPNWVKTHASAPDPSEHNIEITGCDQSDPDRPKFDRAPGDPGDPNPDPEFPDTPDANVKVEQDLDRGGTKQAGAPSAYNVTVHMPYTEASDIHGTHLKNAKVTLPEGITLAPGAGNGLEGCTSGQFDARPPGRRRSPARPARGSPT